MYMYIHSVKYHILFQQVVYMYNVIQVGANTVVVLYIQNSFSLEVRQLGFTDVHLTCTYIHVYVRIINSIIICSW